MTLTLMALDAEASCEYLDGLWPQYRAELIQAGSSEAEADANIERNQQALSPNGVVAAGQFMFRVLEEDQHIGNLWLAQRSPDDWFIYDIEVFEEFRGRGLGRETLRLAEAYVIEQGAKQMGLSVFGFNTAARSLYESAGYSIVSMGMVKRLG